MGIAAALYDTSMACRESMRAGGCGVGGKGVDKGIPILGRQRYGRKIGRWLDSSK